MGRLECRARRASRLRPVPVSWLAVSLVLFAGCGGGGQSFVEPPPAPDFSFSFSATAITVAQGSTSNAVTVSVTPKNGFAGQVQVSMTGLPAGVTANPTSPFTVSIGSDISLLFSASGSAAPASLNLTATATSGNLTHTSSLGLTVQSSAVSPLSRSNYVRTDSVAALDAPPGEPHYRHLALDSVRQRLFIANRARNLVEVISVPDGLKIAEIAAPGATSADLSIDGKTVWIGSVTQAIYELDAAALQTRAIHGIASLAPLPAAPFERPEEVLAMSTGKAFVRMRQAATTESLLAFWDPSTNSMTNLTSLAPQIFQNGLGVMAKSVDGTRLLVAAADSSGELALFDAGGSLIAGPMTVGGGSISYAATNSNATRYALIFVTPGNTQVLLFDSALNPIGTYSAATPTGIVFSADGSSVYVNEQFGGGFVVSQLDGNNLHFVTRFADVSAASVPSRLEATDSSKLLYGLANRGISFIDAAVPASLSQSAPSFSSAPVAQPSTGPNSGGTLTVVTGANFESGAAIQFGAQTATVQSTGATQIHAASPASAASGAVNVSAFFPDGWTTFAPDAFSYGPQILKVLPDTGNKNGNDKIQIYGYGFGTDSSKLTVKIGGASATVQSIDQIPAIAHSLALDSTFPFPLERLTLLTSPGAGVVDISVASPSGSVTLKNGFSYLQSQQVFAKAGFYKFLQYDSSRQRVYLSGIDHVDVFDLASSQFLAPIQPPGGPPPNAGLRGLALTPDNSRLVVADFGAQSIYLINPDTSSGSASFVGGIPGYVNSGPSRVAATSAQTVFVGMSVEGGTQSGCSACLAQMDVSAFPPTIAPATQPEISFLTGSPLLQADASGDHVYLTFASAPGGPIAVWNAASPAQFQTVTANASTIDVAVSQDGNAFAVREPSRFSIRGADLNVFGANAVGELERIPLRTEVPGAAMHPSGALLYVPFLTGPAPILPPATNLTGGVDIFDARTGTLRRRIFLPEPFAMLSTDTDGQHGSFLTIDENGQRLFALTSSGLSVLQLAAVPLGIGSLLPANGPVAGGTSVTLRGSGFQSGTRVTLGAKAVSVTFKDMNTLTFTTPSLAAGAQQLAVTNPNGESVSLDAAFIPN
ncbi:MAG TPA: IPT/TIG domain-containing protein [Candidatus Angelobacter sp.]|nr:IPT/TIG domain-containing protein [Candidatus Angelobacter sp.]